MALCGDCAHLVLNHIANPEYPARRYNGPDDLAGKRVAVVKGSTASAYLDSVESQKTEYFDFSACATSLIAGETDAVVYDTPVIQHFTLKEGRVRVAGTQFRPENYGIAFPVGSPLRRSVNQALLKLFENGAYETLYRKWLGEKAGG
ncbi:MAG: transporter substrate-binding domain-containing protein [Hyphomicrobiales bacterium]|nr:transporter substrate-binding domain-containing protein [Hyphomicrobiales bacterium]